LGVEVTEYIQNYMMQVINSLRWFTCKFSDCSGVSRQLPQVMSIIEKMSARYGLMCNLTMLMTLLSCVNRNCKHIWHAVSHGIGWLHTVLD